jgi:ribulose-phosphate 3-epimerase
MNIQNIGTHIELGDENVRKMMELTRSYDIQYGVVINPHTEVESLKDLVHEVDYVLIMGVVP